MMKPPGGKCQGPVSRVGCYVSGAEGRLLLYDGSYGGEGQSVGWAGAVLAQALQVLGGGVAFVAREAVLRVLRIQVRKEPVPGDFGDDGGGGDGSTEAVALDQRCVGHRQTLDRQSIDQGVVRQGREGGDGLGHGAMGGAQDVQPIDEAGTDDPDAVLARGHEFLIDGVALGGVEELGVGDE